MRIISGEFRGRKLLAPSTEATRPVTDRVKQSLFDILATTIADAEVFDCFAGTGSMGLEALSRGAAHVTFFENDRSALERLRTNIRILGLEPRSTVITSDLFRVLRAPIGPKTANLVFLDPPYRFVHQRPAELARLAADLAAHHLASGALVIFRHDSQDALDLPPLVRDDVREYGSMTVELLRTDP